MFEWLWGALTSGPVLNLCATFSGVFLGFALEGWRERRRHQKEDRADSIATLKALKDDIVKNLELAKEVSNLPVQTVLTKPVDYMNVDPSLWKKFHVERFYRLGLEGEVKSATTFYYILEALSRGAQDFLAWQNYALTAGTPLTQQEAKLMWMLKSGMVTQSDYLQKTFGELPNKIGDRIKRLEDP